jgi:hypothetical protein
VGKMDISINEENEIVADFATEEPESDGGKPPVEEKETPSAKAKGEEPPEEGEHKEPKPEDEVAKVKKDLAKLGYNLRRLEEEKSFVVAQLEEERNKGLQTELEKSKNRKLQEIEHLKDIDPDAYYAQKDKIIEEYHTSRVDEEKKARETTESVRKATTLREEVNQRLMTDYPDITNMESDLFQETKKIITDRYSAEEAAQIAAQYPKTFYAIVEAAALKLEVKKLKSGDAEKERKERIGGQGAVQGSGGGNGKAEVKLDKAAIEFCKKHGYDQAKYAKHLAAMRAS